MYSQAAMWVFRRSDSAGPLSFSSPIHRPSKWQSGLVVSSCISCIFCFWVRLAFCILRARIAFQSLVRSRRISMPLCVAQDARQCAPKPITNQEAGMDAGAHGDNKAAGQKDHPPKTAQRPAALQLCTCLFSTERLRTTPGREVLSPSSRACV